MGRKREQIEFEIRIYVSSIRYDDEDIFEKIDELKSRINYGFVDITGYEIDNIEIDCDY